MVDEMVPLVEEFALTTTPTIVKRPARRFVELSDEQKKLWKIEMTAHQMEKANDRIAQGIWVVDTAIKPSSRSYIPPENMESFVRRILQVLASRYKRSDNEIIQQIYQQYVALNPPPR